MKYDKYKLVDLKARTKYLRIELSQILGKWFYLKNVLYPQLEFQYHQLFGDLEREIDIKSYELNILKLKHHNLSNKNHDKIGQNIDGLNDIAEQIFSKIEKAFENSPIPEYKLNVEYEISYIYRQLVKKLHPDTTNDTEMFNEYWINVQDAYQSKNIHKLRLFHKIICFDDYLELVTLRNLERALLEELNELEKSIKLEKKKINKLMISILSPFLLFPNISRKDRCQTQC